MKLYAKLLSFYFTILPIALHTQVPLELTVSAKNFGPLRILCACNPNDSQKLTPIANNLSCLLQASHQFSLIKQNHPIPITKDDIAQHARNGFPLALFLSQQDQHAYWHLYDTLSVQYIKGKKIDTNILDTPQIALAIADQIWPELTSQQSSFISLIAACKQEPGLTKKRSKYSLYLMHPFLSTNQLKHIKITTTGSAIAPRWHPHKPILFYSQHTPTNVRLMATDTQKKSWVVTSFDGQNLTPTIARNGRTIIVISGGCCTKLYEYTFDESTQKRHFVCLTPMPGDFISPTFINDNDIIFCHINQNNGPRLGILNLTTHAYEWLPLKAALCPAVSPDGATVAFCKKIDGIYQLHTYGLKTKKERQITHGKQHIDECSWSACGNFLTCTIENDQTSRIAVINVHTGAINYLTPINECWAYPHWSARLTLPLKF